MAIQTISDPLDRFTLAEYRAAICTALGVTYANMSTAHQTRLDQIVAAAADYISKRAAHQPWGVSEITATISAGTDTTYSLNAQVRHVLTIVEEETDGTKHPAVYSDRVSYDAAINGTDTHPWTNRTKAVWFFESMTDDAVPLQRWRRIGVDRSGATARIYHRPHFSLSDPQSILPASEREAVLAHAQYKWALYLKNYEAAAAFRQERDDEIAASEVGDRVTHEAPARLGTDAAFGRLLG